MALKNGYIDLRSDTVTHPTEAMRRAMADADVGDDVYQEDPTVNNLENLAAEMVGKEAALFVPSGTMGNLIAVMVHCGRGDEAIMGSQGHTFLHEVGGISALGSIFSNVIPNQNDGTLLFNDIRRAYRGEDIHEPTSRLVIVENTQNQCGGIPLHDEYMRSLSDCTKELNLNLHLDGARIFNAAVALNLDIKELIKPVDSVMFCLSKGLCAPVGSMLCGSIDFIKNARKIRKQLGGGMRQAGILAAAGVIALRDMTVRLEEDHKRAKKLADALMNFSGLELTKGYPQTNMVFVTLSEKITKDPLQIQEDLGKNGILVGLSGKREFRFVTHYWVDETDIEKLAISLNKIF